MIILIGFAAHPHLLRRFSNENATAHQIFNIRHAECRVPVEWAFGIVCKLWSFVDYFKNQKVLLQPVGVYYRLAVLMTNIHACYNGSQVADYFHTTTPTIDEYLHTHI
jgi:hypothetical protein